MGNHDDLLFEMLKECKTLPLFLDNIFGFLKRRTDFYVIQSDPHTNVGLPDGLAESIVRQTYFKYAEKEKNVLSEDHIPVANEETVVCDDVEVIENKPMQNLVLDNVPDVFTGSDSYNGAVYETYSWSQNILDLDIVVKVPENMTAKDLKVNITPTKVSVRLKDGSTILEGDLYKKVKSNDVVWSLDKQKLQIHLEKCLEMWWNCLLLTEPKLDISKIDCSRPYEELSDEAQAKIEELQWNQDRKRMGLPTSEEITMRDKLKKAWNAEGSPFSGPFDPAKVKFN